jgi:hypothetical protein
MTSQARDFSFPGNPRFQLLRWLGEGGSGIVYEALDLAREARLALKVLRKLGPRAILRFKNEFRSLVELHHPNLVRLGELFETGGQWFFTMELVEGCDLLQYVRGADLSFTMSIGDGELQPAYDARRLRRTFAQLADGLTFLHACGKIHRDIKPGNVRVQPDGRVVILDFGLVADADGKQLEDGDHILGTAAYMAPEQAAGLEVGPAADAYAVGVMLFEALTGRLPFHGGMVPVLMAKQSQTAPRARDLVPDVDEELDALCRDLLDRDPSRRPTAEAIGARLARTRERPPPLPPRPAFDRTPADAEMATLADAFARALEGTLARARIVGEPGTGKTALLRALADHIARERPDAMVLVGRCNAKESVPYKAFDAAIDALCRELDRLRHEDCLALVPRRAFLLPVVFPVLAKVRALAEAPPGPRAADRLTLRSQAFAALREMLHRIAERRPTVLLLDDVQWADAESLDLLDELVREPDAPPLLVVAALWRSEACSADVRARVERVFGDATQIDLQPSVRAPGHNPPDPVALGPVAQALLDLVALATAPVPESVLALAAGVARREVAELLEALREARLLRLHQGGDDPRFDARDGRVLARVLERLDEAGQRRGHLALAEAFAAWGSAEPEVLARHWSLGGRPDAAVPHAIRAAESADRVLAFRRAANLYRMAIELSAGDDGRAAERRGWSAKLGDALANSGLDAEAGAAYLQAAAGASTDEALDRQRLAAAHFLRGGHIEQGLATARALLDRVGTALPASPGALRALLGHRLRLRLRGFGYVERREADLPHEALFSCDLLWSVGFSLSTVDQVAGAVLHARAARLSLELGEPRRVARTLVYEGMYGAFGDSGHMLRSRGLIAKAESMARKLGDPYLAGYAKLGWAFAHFSLGEMSEALPQAEDAVKIFREDCAQAVWELGNAHLVAISTRWSLGRLRGLEEQFDTALREAEEHGDLYGATSLVTLVRCCVDLAADRPDECRERVDEALRRWPAGPYLQHAFAAGSHVLIELYRGGAGAHARMEREWPALRRSFVMRPKRSRILFIASRAVAALAAMASGAPAAPLVRLASRCATRLDRERLPDTSGWASLIRGQVCAARGDREGAVREYRRALVRLDPLELMLGRATSERLAELVGGEEGAARLRENAEWARAQGVVRPDRLFAMQAPVRL